MSCISRPAKQPLGWGSPCHRLHMNSLRYSCYLLTIAQVSTNHWPSVDQLLTDTSERYDELSAKCRRKVGEVSVKYRWTKSYIGRDTSVYLTIWLSTAILIDRSVNTIPTVNMIQIFNQCKKCLKGPGLQSTVRNTYKTVFENLQTMEHSVFQFHIFVWFKNVNWILL